MNNDTLKTDIAEKVLATLRQEQERRNNDHINNLTMLEERHNKMLERGIVSKPFFNVQSIPVFKSKI